VTETTRESTVSWSRLRTTEATYFLSSNNLDPRVPSCVSLLSSDRAKPCGPWSLKVRSVSFVALLPTKTADACSINKLKGLIWFGGRRFICWSSFFTWKLHVAWNQQPTFLVVSIDLFTVFLLCTSQSSMFHVPERTAGFFSRKSLYFVRRDIGCHVLYDP